MPDKNSLKTLAEIIELHEHTYLTKNIVDSVLKDNWQEAHILFTKYINEKLNKALQL